MNRLRNLVMALTLLSLSAFAHDGAHGIKGTVTAVSADTITVASIAKKSETIHFDAKTAFIKSGMAATVKDLKIGDRVIIEAHDMNGKMHAVKVRFGKPAKKATHSMEKK